MPVELQKFRDLMAGICAPVTVVTTANNKIPHGATVSAVASLSLEPPMVGVALDRRSQLLARILQSGRFGVNVLAKSQRMSRDCSPAATWIASVSRPGRSMAACRD